MTSFRTSCERREIARRRVEPGWRAAVLDEERADTLFRLRESEEGSGVTSASPSARSAQ